MKHNALYFVLKRTIQRGNIEDMEVKLDIFLGDAKITVEEYNELLNMFKPREEPVVEDKKAKK